MSAAVQTPTVSIYTAPSSYSVKPVSGTAPVQSVADHFARSFTSALKRAADQKLVAYLNSDGSYGVPSHSEADVEHRVCWPEGATKLSQAVCDCAGYRATCCTHRAVAIAAKKAHVHAKRPEAPVVAQAEQVTGRYTAAWFAAEQARTDAVNAQVDALFRH